MNREDHHPNLTLKEYKDKCKQWDKVLKEQTIDYFIEKYNLQNIDILKVGHHGSKTSSSKKFIDEINPKYLLVKLQKEQSLISDSSPKQSQLDWATGYGCPDSWACNPYYKGFGKQINSAALQFRWYMLNPQKYTYKAGNTYTFKNQYGTISNSDLEVYIENTATAALYNYTPHVYNGNYNFWKLWNKYFPTQGYTEGTILKIGESYYLIQNGMSRKFASKSVLTSRFDINKAIEVSASALNAYTEGAPIKFSNYSIIMAPDGKLYLLVDGKKRVFAKDAFKAFLYMVCIYVYYNFCYSNSCIYTGSQYVDFKS
jgi:hypothetical protein